MNEKYFTKKEFRKILRSVIPEDILTPPGGTWKETLIEKAVFMAENQNMLKEKVKPLEKPFCNNCNENLKLVQISGYDSDDDSWVWNCRCLSPDNEIDKNRLEISKDI